MLKELRRVIRMFPHDYPKLEHKRVGGVMKI